MQAQAVSEEIEEVIKFYCRRFAPAMNKKRGQLLSPLLRRGGSNSRPSGYEPDELPLLYFAMWSAKVRVDALLSKRKALRNRSAFPFFTLYVYDLRVTLLEPLVLISRINPSPLNLTLLAPLALAFNSLFTVIFTEDAPEASAVQ